MGQDHAREWAAVFNNLQGVMVKTMRDKPTLTPESDRAQLLPTACAQAMGWISSLNADVGLWGDIPPPGISP